MTDEEIWGAFLEYARAQKALYGVSATTTNVEGRSIKTLLDRLAEFWDEHKDTLIPVLSQLFVAAIEAMIASRGTVDAINPPGPN